MPDTNQKSRKNKSWRDAIDPTLHSRLMLPITRPGMLDHQLTNSITDRIQNMIGGLQLAADVTQRWQTQENTLGNPQPVVFAKPARSQSSSEVIAQPKNTPASPTSLVQAKRVPQAATSKAGSPIVHDNKGLTVVQAKKTMPSKSIPASTKSVAQDKKVAHDATSKAGSPTMHDNKGLTGVQAKKTVPSKNKLGQENPAIEPKNQFQKKVIQRKVVAKLPLKNEPLDIHHDKRSPSQPDDHQQVQRLKTDSQVSSVKKHTNLSHKPPRQLSFPDSKVSRQLVVAPLVKMDSNPPGVQPKQSAAKQRVSQRSTDLPLVSEIRKNGRPQQQFTATPSTGGFKSSNPKTNTRTPKATPFANKNAAANIKSSSAPTVIQRMPMKPTLKTNGPTTSKVIQRVTEPNSSRNSEEGIDVEKIAEEVENKLMEKLNKPVDADEMLEKVERNFMRKLVIENERRGWTR